VIKLADSHRSAGDKGIRPGIFLLYREYPKDEISNNILNFFFNLLSVAFNLYNIEIWQTHTEKFSFLSGVH